MDYTQIKEQLEKIFSQMGKNCSWRTVSHGAELEERLKKEIEPGHELFSRVMSLNTLAESEKDSKALFISSLDGGLYLIDFSPAGETEGIYPKYEAFSSAEPFVERLLQDIHGLETGFPALCLKCGSEKPVKEVHCPYCGAHPTYDPELKTENALTPQILFRIVIGAVILSAVFLVLGIWLYQFSGQLISLLVALPILVMTIILTVKYFGLRKTLRDFAPKDIDKERAICSFCLHPLVDEANYCMICGKKVG